MSEQQEPSFEQLLRDPHEQFDPRSELRAAILASIQEYADAPPATFTLTAQQAVSAERRRMVDTLVGEYRDRQHTGPTVDLAEALPPARGTVTVDRNGYLHRRVGDRVQRIGSVDRGTRRGRAASTWRGVSATGEGLTDGHRTRAAAVRALLVALHINPAEAAS